MIQWNRPANQDMAIGVLRGRFPRVILSSVAAAKMEALVACCNIELSWMATSDLDDGDYRVDDVFVAPQICSGGGTVFRETSLLAMFMGEDGRIAREHFPLIGRMHTWGHSHHRMGVWASGTDDQQAANFISQLDNYFIRLICNKYGDMNVTLYLLDQGIVLHHPVILHETGTTESLDDWAMAEIRQKVQPEMWLGKNEEDEEVNIFRAPFQIGREYIERNSESN